MRKPHQIPFDEIGEIAKAIRDGSNQKLTDNPFNTKMTTERANRILKNGIVNTIINPALYPDDKQPGNCLDRLDVNTKEK